MGKLEEYSKKKTENERLGIYEQEVSRGFKDVKMTEPLSGMDLFDHEQKKIFRETTFEERTNYYFEDYGLMDSKVQRYRQMASDANGLDTYARAHSYHKASTRKGHASDAADYFEEASKLALSFDPETTRGYALYQHREKIMRLRMKGMESAAKAKATDENDENYRILKSRLSCLTVLKDQLEALSQDETITKKEAEKFASARAGLESEIEEVKNSILDKVPSQTDKWKKANGLDDAAVKRKAKEKKTAYSYVNADAVQIEMLMGYFAKDEYDGVRLPQGGYVKGPLRIVLKDGNGNPLSESERAKEEWNKALRKAIGDNDVETRNRMLTEACERVERMDFPALADLKKNGIMHYWKKDPVAFHEMRHTCDALKDMAENDEHLKQYIGDHPLIAQKLELGRTLGEIFDNEIFKSRYCMLKTDYKIRKMEQDSFRNLKTRDAETAENIERCYERYGYNYRDSKTEYGKLKKQDLKPAEEIEAPLNDMESYLVKNISELKGKKRASGKRINNTLAEVEEGINMLRLAMSTKIPLVDADKLSFEDEIFEIQTCFNNINLSIDKCLKKSSNYNGLKHGKLMLQKLKRQYRTQVNAFRGAALAYRDAISDGSIGPFEKGKEPTWNDVFKFTRGVIYDLDKKGPGEMDIKSGGAGQSDILFIKSKAVEVKANDAEVMKELHGSENIKTNVIFRSDDILWKGSVKKFIETEVEKLTLADLKINDPELLARLKKDLLTALKKDHKTVGDDHILDMLELARTGENAFAGVLRSDQRKRNEAHAEGVEPEGLSGWHHMTNLYNDQNDRDYRKLISRAMYRLGRASFHMTMASGNVGIKPGSNISDRHIATSRMANLLGIRDMVCDSRTAYIRKDGKLIKGVVMENSRGDCSSDIIEKAHKGIVNKNLKYTDKAISQIFTMQIFDALCGQVDRNGANFHFTYKLEGNTYLLTGVKLIDNDMSFGFLDGSDVEKGFNRLRPVNKSNVKGLPIDFLNRLMALTPEAMAGALGDLIDKDELDNMTSRLDKIKEVAGELVRDGELVIENGVYSYTKEEDRDDTLRQLNMLKAINDELAQCIREERLDERGEEIDNLFDLSAFNSKVFGNYAGYQNQADDDKINPDSIKEILDEAIRARKAVLEQHR